ncbi:MAG: hypothetical protein AVDCRST_MAG68-2195 [uncultured Gemmatimonadetes bacterium]|uniref:DUF2149 domain-containing protein n=1 Tax=uncultured Gemmatimonadota bacterium TaxID=203437 RepID=A0A6J4L847_9BACT|nr:MAG: hypothetical protein AVDCRST_MAG68-2195 [uncultured Gemmatimonadota bacterium]
MRARREAGPGGVRLRRGRAGGRFRREADDPLTGIANLADVMLVFACGLLVALVTAWDLSRALDPELRARALLEQMSGSVRELQEADTTRGGADPTVGSAAGRYRNMGRVYRDTATGRMYVVEEP